MKCLFLFLVVLIGCGKTKYTTPAAPENYASPLQASLIDTELAKLEADFKELGVPINLKKLPVIVSPLPGGVVGRCQYGVKNEGKFIILSPDLFVQNEMFPETEATPYEEEFVRVLIHEIGHCYFYRNHEDPAFFSLPGKRFEFAFKEDIPFVLSDIPKSLMPGESFFRLPKVLRKYYLAEVAGLVSLKKEEDLGKFTAFKTVENTWGTITYEPAVSKYCPGH